MGELLAGYGRVEITPPLTIPYLGFVPRQAFFTGVHDPLYARALALEVGDSRALLVVADAIGFDNRILGPGRDFTAEFRRRVEAVTGLKPEQVMLACTHAHSTPETLNFRRLLDHPGVAEWLSRLLDQLAEAGARAWEDRRPHSLRLGAATIEGLSIPRRAPVVARHRGGAEDEVRATYPLDRTARVALLTDAAGRRLALTHYACHPVTVQVQELVSADFPGAALEAVQRALPDCVGALFLQGCDGDVNPPMVTRDFADVERYGLILAGGFLQAIGHALGSEPLSAALDLATATATLSLPSRPLPPSDDIRAVYDRLTTEAAAAGDEATRHELLVRRRGLEEQLVRLSWGDDPIAAEVQALRLGPLAIVGLPGEPFAALGLEIVRRSPAEMTMVTGYVNDYRGYLAPPEAWAEGGYEVALGPWSHVGPEAPGLLIDAAAGLLARLWGTTPDAGI